MHMGMIYNALGIPPDAKHRLMLSEIRWRHLGWSYLHGFPKRLTSEAERAAADEIANITEMPQYLRQMILGKGHRGKGGYVQDYPDEVWGVLADESLPWAARVARAGMLAHAIYESMVAAMDDSMSSIWRALGRQGMSEKTLALFASDNGPVRKEYGADPGRGLVGGKNTRYDGGVRVPALAYWPGRLAPRTVQQPMYIADWFMTILEAAGVEPTPPRGGPLLSAPPDGVSAWPALVRGEAIRPKESPFLVHATLKDKKISGANAAALKLKMASAIERNVSLDKWLSMHKDMDGTWIELVLREEEFKFVWRGEKDPLLFPTTDLTQFNALELADHKASTHKSISPAAALAKDNKDVTTRLVKAALDFLASFPRRITGDVNIPNFRSCPLAWGMPSTGCIPAAVRGTTLPDGCRIC